MPDIHRFDCLYFLSDSLFQDVSEANYPNDFTVVTVTGLSPASDIRVITASKSDGADRVIFRIASGAPLIISISPTPGDSSNSSVNFRLALPRSSLPFGSMKPVPPVNFTPLVRVVAEKVVCF